MAASAYGVTARELLALEPHGDNRFRNLHNLGNGRGASIFGGQPMLQGLAAARATLAHVWPAHSYSAQFLRAGDPALPIDYLVEPTRDGRRFASRRVVAMQHGKPIYDMVCGFHDAEDGPAHDSAPPPAIAAPETLESLADCITRHADRLPAAMVEAYGGDFPIELRIPDLETLLFDGIHQPARNYWLRMPSAAGIDDPCDQQCLLAFLSDYWLAGTAGAPHFKPTGLDGVAVVTLNHSLWFHRPVRVDEWLLYATQSPWAGGGRGIVRGLIHDRAGTLMASVVQEASIRRGG